MSSSSSSFYNMFGNHTRWLGKPSLTTSDLIDGAKKPSSSQINTQISCKMKYARNVRIATAIQRPGTY